jgi:16S rRNA (uracil1498-N3)-methyltransferase
MQTYYIFSRNRLLLSAFINILCSVRFLIQYFVLTSQLIMKEERFFYAPSAYSEWRCGGSGELPQEEAVHVVRVLRMQTGDEIFLVDGVGSFYRSEITAATQKRCTYIIKEHLPQAPAWQGHLHLAMAPTKNMDRTEWMAEKATEIGFNELSFLNCRFSERKVLKGERIDKILISAMKQSHKAWKPVLNEMVSFEQFVKTHTGGDRFIAHCYEMEDVGDTEKPFLFDVLKPGHDAVVMVGPEGDFSVDEVKLALQHGFRSISLGRSRLRTETAALAAVHLMQIKNQL